MDDFTRTQPIGDQIRDLAAREEPAPLTPGDLARLDRIDAVLRDALPTTPTR
ncbi:hypothetical protein [Gordonia iterans]|uniref:hypothetical protein n=1 Tax=Gordonia iterans TaxID=1004901 RepID=UPI00131BC30C|nr:hypothetical protein [Gordonia iterans]